MNEEGGEINILFNCAQLIADQLSCDLNGVTAFLNPNTPQSSYYEIKFKKGVLQASIPENAEYIAKRIASGFFGVKVQTDRMFNKLNIRS